MHCRCPQFSSTLQTGIDTNSLYLQQLTSTQLTDFKDTPVEVVSLVCCAGLVDYITFCSSTPYNWRLFGHISSRLNITLDVYLFVTK